MNVIYVCILFFSRFVPFDDCMLMFSFITLSTTRHFQVGDTGSQVLERPSTRLSGRRLPSCRPWSSWLTVSRQYDAEHPSYDDVTGRQNICRRRTAFLLPPVTVVVNLRKAAENPFVCLRVAALVTYELAPWKCTD